MSYKVVNGTVKFFLAEHGYGFARVEGSGPTEPDIYLHWTQIIDQPGQKKALAPGQPIQFQIVPGKAGRLAAINIQAVKTNEVALKSMPEETQPNMTPEEIKRVEEFVADDSPEDMTKPHRPEKP